MDYRMPLQRLLHRLLPSLATADAAATAYDFADTRPDDEHVRTTTALPRTAPAPRQSQSTIDLVLGTEVMEYPEDTVADLMDEFFAEPHKRAA